MHDIRLIRDDPAAFDAAMAKRGLPASAETLVALDRRRREVHGLRRSVEVQSPCGSG